MAAGSTGRYSAQTVAWYKRHTSPASPSIHKTGKQEHRMKNIIVITGASSGFGSLASHALARAGYTVYAGMRETRGCNAPQVEEADRFSKEHGVDLRTVEMDVSNQPSVDAPIKAIIEQQGHIDVLIHNAGHMVFGPADAFT